MTDFADFKRLPADERDALGFARWKELGRIGTHNDEQGCWGWGRSHYDCALAEIERAHRREAGLQEQHSRDSQELRYLCAARDAYQRDCTEARKALAEALEEMKQLRADADRLNWLIGQDACVVNEGTNGFWLCWIDEHDHARSEYQPGSYPTARAAIDAAMALKSKP